MMRMLLGVLRAARAERFVVDSPVTFGSGFAIDMRRIGRGRAKNLSATGVYFETDKACDIGSKIHFSIELDGPNGKSMLRCSGTIVRSEALPNRRHGFGVSIQKQRMEPVL